MAENFINIMKMYSRSGTTMIILIFFCIVCFAVTVINGYSNMDDEIRKPYIVYMGAIPENTVSMEAVHHQLLSEAIGNVEIARESKFHSYGKSFNAIAARLLPHEAKILSQNENVISVFPSRILQLQTTRSWDFLGMPLDVKRIIQKESNIIVALLDTGIDTQSQSFNDSGFGPPPLKWKGQCQEGLNFTGCNNKVIGARYFDLEGKAPAKERSPADFEGHGTHTSSTAAGTAVPEASFHGIAEGTARGGVPSARIASYNVCTDGCSDANILAGFDAAIDDGADIISVSLALLYPLDYFESVIAIGSFHAVQKGILVVCAGGNQLGEEGLFTIENYAPWIMTVGASTTDRSFETKVDLDDGRSFSGDFPVNLFGMKKMHSLLNGVLAKKDIVEPHLNISACDSSSLDPRKVKGNILFCRGNNTSLDTEIQKLGAAGLIQSTSDDMRKEKYFLTEFPYTIISVDDGDQIDAYIYSTKHAKAKIHKTVTVTDKIVPTVAKFSSRGPQNISRNILKPDITAPGVSILAAYSKLEYKREHKKGNPLPFRFSSGTSMAAPHVSGAAAYVKSFHPDWSPAAIKSALMTTAKPFKNKIDGAELATGSGLLNPTKALNPGLIYDINEESYIKFLCKEGYSSSNISKITGKNVNCSNLEKAKGTDGLNYPSMHIQLEDTTHISAVFYRTVTYVGEGKSVFKAEIDSPDDLTVTVSPDTLSFSEPKQEMSFNVTLEGKFREGEANKYLSALLTWRDDDAKRSVRSPILVFRL